MNWKEEVQERKDQLLSDLSQLLSIKSIKDPSTASNDAPMGKNIKEALDFMLQTAEEDGFRTNNIEGYIGYAEIGPADASEYISILCHLDVVPATGEWESDPFSPEIREGKLFSRGAIDDKGPTMAAYYALKIIKENDLPLKHRIRIIFGTDEESGMSCMKKYVQVEPKPLTGFAPDAEFPIIHAEKGQINVVLKLNNVKKKNRYELLSFYSGEKGNMVPDHAEAVLQRNELSLIKEKFSSFCNKENLKYSVNLEKNSIRLTIKGKSAHGMEPEKGINAGTKLAKYLASEIRSEPYIQFISERLDDDPNGIELGISFSDDITGPLTVNPGVFRYHSNEKAYLTLNIRCPVETPYLRTIEKLNEVIKDYGFEVEEVREKKPHHVDKEQPIIKILQQAYEHETGENAALLTTGGATYARFIENGVAYGAVFPGKENTAHQKNEYIILEDLYKATAIYARAIYNLANL
ncbi:succinyl-diaminopimelate desuccinylase [Cytobacillus eiseniae]|uniref:Succinyl-diaminopimelate desuccinylase n=1 Tax=Cytobacillus eiseniae TaxID=762947 RepID=A0ABS4RHU4_9BACI|nr:dipeptidase PepV [Cytobacillus eiseniae]MBP2242473.1 succinyl-diaminopimelate desuccinylase [Cytobacillus eiseniae]